MEGRKSGSESLGGGALPEVLAGRFKPGCIYSSRVLLGRTDALANEEGQVFASSARAVGVAGPPSRWADAAESRGSSETEGLEVEDSAVGSSVASLWGSASEEPCDPAHSGAVSRFCRGEGVSVLQTLEAKSEQNPAQAAAAARCAEEFGRLGVFCVRQAVAGNAPLRLRNANAEQRNTSAEAGRGAGKEELLLADNLGPRQAAATGALSSRSSRCSTLILNAKTRRLERVPGRGGRACRAGLPSGGNAAAASGVEAKADPPRVRSLEEAKKLSLLWEAFQRASSSDPSGWLSTRAFVRALETDRRILEIFNVETASPPSPSSGASRLWKTVEAFFYDSSQSLALTRAGEKKQRAMVNQVRRIESDLIDNERATQELKMSFETFAVSFSKFVGNQPDTQWLKTGDEFVEVAVCKEPVYSMTMSEMLVRDSVLGCSLSKSEARRPESHHLGAVRILEPPNSTLLSSTRAGGHDAQEAQLRGRLAEAKLRLKVGEGNFEEKVALRLRREAEATELEMLARSLKQAAIERVLEKPFAAPEGEGCLPAPEQRRRKAAPHLRPLPQFV